MSAFDQFIHETPEGVFYPPSIPRSRGKISQYLTLALASSFYIGSLLTTDDKYSLTLFYAHGTLLTFAGEFLHRITNVLEEFPHLQSRYNNCAKTMWWQIMGFSPESRIAFGLASIFTIFNLGRMDYTMNKYAKFLSENLVMKFLSFLFFNSLLKKYISIDSSLLHSWFQATKIGIDYGTGMAHSFFYGYLNLILPKLGPQDMDLKDTMMLFESSENIKFEVYKLFILLPRSFNCPSSLNVFDGIEMAKSLNEKEIDNSGVRERVYKNSVYKILRKDRKPLYICAEYATPLNTFYKSINGNSEHSAIYGKLGADVGYSFYTTLNNILHHKKLDHVCELIYFDDMNEKNVRYPVDKILLARLRQINDKNK